MTDIINFVCGPEPMREGEYPDCVLVGSDGITRIEVREDNLGTYGIKWFDAYAGDRLVSSFNAVHIAVVKYAKG